MNRNKLQRFNALVSCTLLSDDSGMIRHDRGEYIRYADVADYVRGLETELEEVEADRDSIQKECDSLYTENSKLRDVLFNISERFTDGGWDRYENLVGAIAKKLERFGLKEHCKDCIRGTCINRNTDKAVGDSCFRSKELSQRTVKIEANHYDDRRGMINILTQNGYATWSEIESTLNIQTGLMEPNTYVYFNLPESK